ncbi:unnamed protein product [Prorocentrum cordatum]|uniref:Uncharacterized protein n=1 Tax=Prorocentrum cordatum TaxID=2364126 RepID=A0ABN9PHH6_9DINO|nr:unnamed protein product [Polarella glacialis]
MFSALPQGNPGDAPRSMRSRLSTRSSTQCRARHAAAHVLILSGYATITCSAGVRLSTGTREPQARDCIGHFDVFMMQASMEVANEVQRRTIGVRSPRGSRQRTPPVMPPSGMPAAAMPPPSGMPAAALPPSGMPAAASPPSGMPAAAWPAAGLPAAGLPPPGMAPAALPPAGLPPAALPPESWPAVATPPENWPPVSAPTPCVDTANGATNRFGKGCDVYTHDAENPFSGICFDPYYDDDDFSSGKMCCVCPEECPTEEPYDRPSDCEDWIEFSIHNTVGVRNPHSNLGGLGPDGDKPKEIRYYGVGRLPDGVFYDLVFTNTSTYVPKNTNWNTILGSQAILNTLVGETTTVKAEFVRNHTFCPIVPVLPKITFCDIDHFVNGENEILMLDGVSALYTVDGDVDYMLEVYEPGSVFNENPLPVAYTTESIPTQVPGRTARKFVSSTGGKFGVKATSQMFGHGCDNPTDSNELTNITCPDENAVPVDQAKRCFMAEFSDTSEFEVGFKILTYHPPGHVQEWGRNFAMSGTSRFFAHEGSNTCTPTASEVLSAQDLATAGASVGITGVDEGVTGVSGGITSVSGGIAAPPTPAPCVDPANGATNRLGNGCEVYTHDAENPFSGICFDPYYDDDDFTSGEMCCVCPEECPAEEPYDRPDVCEDWVEFTTLNSWGVRNPHSNLGGLGPDLDKPKELRYYGVGRLPNGVFYDLVFTNISTYTPRNTTWNTVFGAQAIVNTLVGQTTTIKAEFVRNHTFCPLVPVRPKITFCDIDHFVDGENEILMLDGVSALYTVDGAIDYALELYELGSAFNENPVPLTYTTESIPTLISGRTARKFVSSTGSKFGIKATSQMFGHGCDNPTGPNELINITCPDENAVPVDQAKRCFMAEFDNTSEFEVGYRVLTYHPPEYVQEWGRNFVMSGTSRFFAHEGTETCTPTAKEVLTPSTFAPTSPPTPAPTMPFIPEGDGEFHAGSSSPTPAPAPPSGPVSAIGDPHLVNVHGQRFDLMKPGVHVLLRVPFRASRLEALIVVEAEAQRIGGACADTYFMSINMTGTWVETKVNALGLVGGHGLYFNAGTGAAHTGTPWMSFGRVWLKVRHGRTSTGTAYLNFFARNLRHSGHLVGGLLGEDDHTEAETLNIGCKKTLEI